MGAMEEDNHGDDYYGFPEAWFESLDENNMIKFEQDYVIFLTNVYVLDGAMMV